MNIIIHWILTHTSLWQYQNPGLERSNTVNDLSKRLLEFQLEDCPLQIALHTVSQAHQSNPSITASQDVEPTASDTDASLDVESIASSNISLHTSDYLLTWWGRSSVPAYMDPTLQVAGPSTPALPTTVAAAGSVHGLNLMEEYNVPSSNQFVKDAVETYYQ